MKQPEYKQLITAIVPYHNLFKNWWELPNELSVKLQVICIFDGIIPTANQINYLENSIETVVLPKNQGQAKATKRGLELISSKWFILIDSDDYIDFNRFPPLDSLLCDTKTVYFPKTIRFTSGRKQKHRSLESLNQVLHVNRVGCQSGAIINFEQMKQVGFHTESLTSCIDWDLWIKLRLHGCKFVTYEGTVIYNDLTEGISRNLQKVILGRLELFKLHNHIFSGYNLFLAYIRLTIYCAGNCKISYFKNNQISIKVIILFFWLLRPFAKFYKRINRETNK